MKRGLSQEGMKIIACVSMLLDHIGVTIVLTVFYNAAESGGNAGALLDLYETLRILGRLAFPIYCFLLAEGSHYTLDPKKYALRLGIGAILSEIPFDLAFSAGWDWGHQNVMLTLLLGFCALELMKKCPNILLKILAAVPFMLLADLMNTDYGANGVMLIAMFDITREFPHKRLLQFLGMWFVFSPMHAMMLNWLGGISVTVQECALLSMIPISLYSGEKRSGSKVLQWCFYLFYPVHLMALYGIGRLL